MAHLIWDGMTTIEEPRQILLQEDPSLSFSAPKQEPEYSLATLLAEPPDEEDALTDNWLVKGENLAALKYLQTDFTNKIRLVYLDPPYNTGKKWGYYLDKVSLDSWLSFMSARVQMLWPLLTEDGSLWISIDKNLYSYLSLMLIDQLGPDAHLSTIVWQHRYSTENRSAIGDQYEYILVLAKDPKLFKKNRNKLPYSKEHLQEFKNPDNDPRGLWKPVNMTVMEGSGRPNQCYNIITRQVEFVSPRKEMFIPT